MQRMSPSIPSPFRAGADNGIWFGLYLILFLGLWVGGTYSTLLGLPWLLVSIAGPWLLYRLLVRDCRRTSRAVATFAWVWLDGILTVLFGSLIAALALYCYLRWANPSFLDLQWQNAIDALRPEGASPSQQIAADRLQQAAAQGMGITPITFVMSMLWSSTLLGSLLSLIFAGMARRHAKDTF